MKRTRTISLIKRENYYEIKNDKGITQSIIRFGEPVTVIGARKRALEELFDFIANSGVPYIVKFEE